MRLSLAPSTLKVQTTNAEQEEAVEEIDVDYAGEPLEVGFNVSYLTDVLTDTRMDSVQIALRDGQSSVLITCAQRPGFKYVVSPMRI